MENRLEAKSRRQGMLMGNRLRWQRWESSVLLTSTWRWDCWGTALESPILTWKWGLTDQHLGDQRKAAEEGRCCQPPQLSCSRAQPPLYLLTCSSPGCVPTDVRTKWAASGKRTCDTTLPTNILWGVGMQKMNKWEVFRHWPTYYKSVSWPRS